MSRRVKMVVAAGIVAVFLAALLAGTALAQGMTPWGSPGGTRGGWGPGSMMGGWGPGGMMGRGMMGGWRYGITPTTGITGTMPYGYGPGACPVMGGWGRPGTGTPISLDQAIEKAQQFLTAYGNSDLTLTEVMEFSNHFYAEVKEESTGIHALELLIDRYTGTVHPEPGPNMMWNTKYGHMGGMMGGMMGGWWGRPNGPMTVTPEQARTNAQQWLDANLPGTTVAPEADAFYGYYAIHVLQNDAVVGMLSVNGYTGQVWYHTWHGDFIGMRELEE